MASFNWHDSYSIGNTEVDTQHKKLIVIINELYEANRNRTGQAVIENTLNKLVDYTNYHFSKEEEMFTAYNYPGKENHTELHNDFKEKLEKLKEKADYNDPAVITDTLNFLMDWLVDHIIGADKDFGIYMKRVEL